MTIRVRVSARSRSSPVLYHHFNRPSGFWPSVKSCLVGGSDKYHTSAGRGVNGTDLVECVKSSGHTTSLRGLSLQALTLQGFDFSPVAPLFREMLKGPEAFLEYGPVPGSTLKKGIVPYSSVWWDGRQIPLITKLINVNIKLTNVRTDITSFIYTAFCPSSVACLLSC